MAETLARSAMIVTGGAMHLCLDGTSAALSSRKALAVLTYLALQPGGTESRERISSLLWSDSGPDQGRAALRQTLRRLKADLGNDEDLVEADRHLLRLARPVRLDILEAIEVAARGEVPDLLGSGDAVGTLFADLEDLDPDFNLWIAVQRERLGAQLLAKLETAIGTAGDAPLRLELAEALARLDPTHEGAARAAMQAHLALGDVGQAMRVYERLWKVLDEDLDVEPSERTQALYVAIKQGSAQPAAPAPPEPDFLLAPIAIVVEPTATAHLPDSFRYFGEIFRGEMVAALSRFRDWLVIDGGPDVQTPPTYRAYFLRITLHSQHDSIVVGMMLVDQADNRCIWSERHTATLDSLATLHRTALRLLAVALNVHLSAPRLQQARKMTSPTGRRYELWMQAQALMGEWRADAEDRAEAILRELITATPDFAPALVALAQINNSRPIVYPGRPVKRERLEESLDLTSRAVTIDPLDSRAHLCRSWAHAVTGSHHAALSHLDLALDLNENDPWTLISAALGFAFAGETDQARRLVEQTRSFGMRYSRAAQGYISNTLFLIADYEGSSVAAEVAGDAIINLPAWQAAGRMRCGDPEGAAQAMARFLSLARASWVGAPNPSDRDAIEWFMGCFPIRPPETRDALRASLDAALAEKKRRLG